MELHNHSGRPRRLGATVRQCRQASETVSAAGGRAQTIHLPQHRGIAGNSHLMMQDRNNTEIGGMILEWLRAEFGGSG